MRNVRLDKVPHTLSLERGMRVNGIKRELSDSSIVIKSLDADSDNHVIRSHRAPRAFPTHRLLLAFMVVALSAGFINTASIPKKASAEPLGVPQSLQWVPPVPSTTPAFDTGSEVDTVRAVPMEKSSRMAAVRKPPPLPPVEKAIAYALAQQGKPYRWAQAGPSGFDCSGLVLAAFKQIGISLPHYTGTMIGYGKKIPRSAMQRGDIVFPTSGHVAIYLGNNMMVAASSGQGKIVVQKVYSFYAARRLV